MRNASAFVVLIATSYGIKNIHDFKILSLMLIVIKHFRKGNHIIPPKLNGEYCLKKIAIPIRQLVADVTNTNL